jgi:hypothetical protein
MRGVEFKMPSQSFLYNIQSLKKSTHAEKDPCNLQCANFNLLTLSAGHGHWVYFIDRAGEAETHVNSLLRATQLIWGRTETGQDTVAPARAFNHSLKTFKQLGSLATDSPRTTDVPQGPDCLLPGLPGRGGPCHWVCLDKLKCNLEYQF